MIKGEREWNAHHRTIFALHYFYMNARAIKRELQTLVSGTSGASYDAVIKAAANHLRSDARTGPMDSGKFDRKGQEKARLIAFAQQYNLIISEIYEEEFVSSGAEQKVYIQDERHVVKLKILFTMTPGKIIFIIF